MTILMKNVKMRYYFIKLVNKGLKWAQIYSHTKIENFLWNIMLFIQKWKD